MSNLSQFPHISIQFPKHPSSHGWKLRNADYDHLTRVSFYVEGYDVETIRMSNKIWMNNDSMASNKKIKKQKKNFIQTY